MALLTGVGVSPSARRPSFPTDQVYSGLSGFKLLSFSSPKTRFQPVQLQQSPMRLHVSCSAKPQTVEMVCEIVKKQLVLPEDTSVTAQSTFSALGADSLDTVEIVMGLEEAFGITVEEDNAHSITTVQDAADLIEKLVEAKTT
ncbi:hypothetical protein KSP39_PZI017320 [Platanthera zijinensis]|uniref:Acyl carrier protein n=1 Tax=Platanthera zijinensis TaxID=2320716 RepID=A0AAP0FZT2_9ASPA